MRAAERAFILQVSEPHSKTCSLLLSFRCRGIAQTNLVASGLGRRGSGVQIAPPRPMESCRYSDPPYPEKTRCSRFCGCCFPSRLPLIYYQDGPEGKYSGEALSLGTTRADFPAPPLAARRQLGLGRVLPLAGHPRPGVRSSVPRFP